MPTSKRPRFSLRTLVTLLTSLGLTSCLIQSVFLCSHPSDGSLAHKRRRRRSGRIQAIRSHTPEKPSVKSSRSSSSVSQTKRSRDRTNMVREREREGAPEGESLCCSHSTVMSCRSRCLRPDSPEWTTPRDLRDEARSVSWSLTHNTLHW